MDTPPAELSLVPAKVSTVTVRASQAGKLVVIGGSRGGEAALLLGAVYPTLVYAVVSYVGSSVVGPSTSELNQPAWTLDSKLVPFITGADLTNPDPTDNPQAIIPVWKIAGPILLISATDDRVWPSAQYAAAIARRLRAHKHPYTTLVYPHAGHGVATAVPNLPTALTITHQQSQLSLGGTLQGTAHANADSWPKLLTFLKQLGS